MRNTRIETSKLPSFTYFLARNVRLVASIEHIVFVGFADLAFRIAEDDCGSITSITERLAIKNAQEFMVRNTGQPIDFEEWTLAQVFETTTWLRWETTSGNLRPFLFAYEREESSENKLATYQNVCSLIRAFVLKFCSNLKSLSTGGADIGFPFCERRVRQGPVLIESLSSLTQISFRNWDWEKPVLSSRNIVFLLVALPQLKTASLYGSLDEADLVYLQDPSDFFRENSKVKHLELELLDSLPKIFARGEELVPTAITQLISVTKGLSSFSFHYGGGEAVGRLGIFSSLVSSLKSSFSSITTMKFEGLGFSPTSDRSKCPLLFFPQLESLNSNMGVVSRIFRDYQLHDNCPSHPMVMPPSLKELILPYNYMVMEPQHVGHIKEIEQPESTVKNYLKEFKESSSIRRLVTSKEPVDIRGRFGPSVNKRRDWIKARRDLEDSCTKVGFELVLVEEKY